MVELGALFWRLTRPAPAAPAPGWYWTQHPAVTARINRLISGHPDLDAYGHLVTCLADNDITAPLPACATLGCGDGWLERGLIARELVGSIDGYDPSPAAIETARDLAARQGLTSIHYHIADVATLSLPDGAFDAVFSHGAMVHVEALESLFANVRQSLKPGGVFHLFDFVGPSRFQWTDAQIELINGFLETLPTHLRQMPDGPKPPLRRPPIEQMIAETPTLAARSAEIRRCLGDMFDIIEDRPFGGALLHQGLAGIAQNFNPASRKDMAHLERFFALEDRMVRFGTIGSDFTVLTARPRPMGAPRPADDRPAPFGMPPTRQLRPAPGQARPGLDLTVDKTDTMLMTSDAHYLSVGVSALGIIARHLGGRMPANILDLPCGFGRVTRALRARYPNTPITASDLDRPGVDFTAYRFGASGVYSVPDFRQLDFGETFDLIWVGSLMTHLPARTTKHLLAALARSLSPGGSAFITLQGPSTIPRFHATGYGLPARAAARVVKDFERTGYGYRDYVGSGALYGISMTNDNYGISLTDEGWMRAAMAESGLRLHAYDVQAWDDHHDVAVARRMDRS